MGEMAHKIHQTNHCMKITDKKQKRAMLLHYAGPSVDEIFDTLEDTGDEDDYDKAVEKLNDYFKPKANVTYEVYIFRQAKQKEEETIDSFHTRLRQLSRYCAFPDVDKEIKEQIILNCCSNSLRRKALREDLDLEKLLKAGRALELSESQAKEVEKNEAAANAIGSKRERKPQTPSKGQPKVFPAKTTRGRHTTVKPRANPKKCGHCGGEYPHKDGPCRAKGKRCNSCGKLNHFAKECRSNPDRQERREERHTTQHSTRYRSTRKQSTRQRRRLYLCCRKQEVTHVSTRS